ncbi:MAG: VOC family protein [Acidimicrobiales bacterium]
MTTTPRSGTISWVDLSTPDVDDACRFYRDLLGWELALSSTPMGDYWVATVDGRDVAGLMAQSAESIGQPATWTVFVWCEQLDATLEQIGSAGGQTLVPPFEIPGGARVAVVADPGGAMFALISGGPEPGEYFSSDVGGVAWAELMTRQIDVSVTFYREVFGWSVATSDSGGTPYNVFSLDGVEVAGMIETPRDLPSDLPASWSMYFVVDTCRAAEERVHELGGQVLLSSTPTPMGPFAVVSDRQGAVFQLMELQGE